MSHMDLRETLAEAKLAAEWCRKAGIRRLSVPGVLELELGTLPVVGTTVPLDLGPEPAPDPLEQLAREYQEAQGWAEPSDSDTPEEPEE